MNCTICGATLNDDAICCNVCGSPITSTSTPAAIQDGAEIKSEKPITISEQTERNVYDHVSVGTVLLGLFLPVIGFILYFFIKKNTPKKAKGLLICSLIVLVPTLIMYAVAIAMSLMSV